MKLEEDYAQNTKNHEEEVQLRLKFESKLNNMHSAHRDLESKYKRVLTDLANANKQLAMLNAKLLERNSEVTSLKTSKAHNESVMAQDKEEIASAKREINIKSKQLKELETRCT
jgi:chromosome segregation ATPase